MNCFECTPYAYPNNRESYRDEFITVRINERIFYIRPLCAAAGEIKNGYRNMTHITINFDLIFKEGPPTIMTCTGCFAISTSEEHECYPPIDWNVPPLKDSPINNLCVMCYSQLGGEPQHITETFIKIRIFYLDII